MNTLANNNRDFIKANFMNGFKNKRLRIVLILVNIFAIPNALIHMCYLNSSLALGLLLTSFAMVVNMIMGIVIPFFQFDYCYDRTKVDGAYMLPLTRRQKFLSDYFGGLGLYVLCYLGQMIMAYITMIIYCLIRKEEDNISYWGYRIQDRTVSWLFGTLSIILITVLLTQVLLYTVTTFVIACTGAMFEAVSATIYFNVLLPSTVFMIYLLSANRIFGFELGDYFWNFILRTSPIGGFFSLVSYWDAHTSFSNWCICYIATIIVFFALCAYIMIRRNAESVGKTFVIRPFYYAILIAIMLHIGAFATYTNNNVFSYIILTFICYFIIELVTNRGIAKMKQSILRYVALTAVVLGVIILINRTNSFGVAYHVANVDDVDSITISCHNLFKGQYIEDIKITDKEEIATILELQQELIDEYKSRIKNGSIFELSFANELDEYEFDTSRLYMEVKGDGENYSRSYVISYREMMRLLSVQLSDEYIEQVIKEYRECTDFLGMEDVYGINNKRIIYSDGGKQTEMIDRFFDALEMDWKDCTEEEYLRPKETTKYVVETNEGIIPILNSYTNTIALLEEYTDLVELSESDYENILLSNHVEIIYLERNENEEELIENGYYSTCNYGEYAGDVVTQEIGSFSEELLELMQVAQVQYAADEPVYLMYVGGRTFVIPTEYSELAEKVMELNESYTSDYDMYNKDYTVE